MIQSSMHSQAYEADYKVDWLAEQEYTTLIMLREADESLTDLPISEWCGGNVTLLRANVMCLHKGERYRIAGVELFV